VSAVSTDNTTPRLTKELMGVYTRLEVIIPRIPIVVGRLDAEQPGFPTGHSGGGSPVDGPDRYQTSDPAYGALRALLMHVDLISRRVAELDQLTGNWMRRNPTTRDRTIHHTEGRCTSCIRVGEIEPTHRGDLCRWCYDTLGAVNKLRADKAYGPALLELPVDAVRQRHSGSRGRFNELDRERWARPERKAKR
jgi:hypothetical protein